MTVSGVSTFVIYAVLLYLYDILYGLLKNLAIEKRKQILW